MAVPTFTSITPSYGPSGGYNVVTIIGTNFRVPSDPEESVEVYFDGIVSGRVDVLSTTELRVLVPPNHKKGADAAAVPFPAIDIIINNIDSAGDPITGETVTTTKAYTYRRSPIRLPRATEENQPYRRIINEVIWNFQRQLIPNVAIGTNVDFGEEGETIIASAELPSIVLVGPRVIEDMENRHRWADFEEAPTDDPTIFEIYRDAYVAIFEFDAILAADKRREIYGMTQGMIALFKRTPYLKIPITIDAPNDGYYEFPFILESPPNISIQEANSNLIVGGSVIQVRAIPIRLDEYEDVVDSITEGEMQVYQGIDLSGTDYESIPFADSD